MRFRDWFDDEDVEVPEAALALGMQDCSWHNDASPSLDWIKGGKRLVLWVGYPTNPEGFPYTQSEVQVYDCNEGGANAGNDPLVLFTGDLDGAILACEAYIKERT